MIATRPRLATLGFALVLLAACSGGETVLGERDGESEADAGEDRADADVGAEADVTDDAGETAVEVDGLADHAEDMEEATDEVAAVCGNGVVEFGEECDLLNLDGETCVSRGHDAGGTLRCDAACRFDESWCRNPECGDGTCALGETAAGCPADCHDGCGDGSCAEAEDQFGCSADCGAVAISVGFSHACTLLTDGTVRCWGDNGHGRLGDGTTGSSGGLPVAVTGLGGVIAVSAGAHATCAVLADGTARCWGEYRTLGDGLHHPVCDLGERCSPNPVTVAGLTTAADVSVGLHHACAALSDGTARCWGFGYLGDGVEPPTSCPDGTFNCSPSPVSVSLLTTTVAVAVGYSHSCALLSDGTTKCWGANEQGELGMDGSSTTTPVTVVRLPRATDISAGTDHSCAALGDGTARCWGGNWRGQLGGETPGGSSHDGPVAVSGLTGVASVSAGGRYSCAVLADQSAFCWGANLAGELGDGSFDDTSVPVPVAGLTAAVDVAAGLGGIECPYGVCSDGNFTCAVLPDGTAWCWGSNNFGQLGNGTTTDSAVPVQVAAW